MRKLLSLLVIFIASFSLQAQMDSISVNVYFEGEVQSPFDTTQTLPIIKLQMHIGDFDFFGELFVEVLDQASGQPLYRVKYKAQQILNEGWMTNGTMLIDLSPKFIDGSVIVVSRISDYSGAIHFYSEQILE